MKSKIISATVLSIVGLLIATTLVLYFIPVNYAPTISNPDSIRITNTENNSTKVLTTTNQTEYNKFLTKFKQSFTRSKLSAIFAGQNSVCLNLMDSKQLPSFNIANIFPDINGYKIEFIYSQNTAQTLNVDGNLQNQTYKNITFQVIDNATYKESNIYFIQTNNNDFYTMKTFSSQAVLFDYVEEILA